MELNKLIRYLAGVVLTSSLATPSLPYKEEIDLNGDGRKDILTINERGYPSLVSIKEKDGPYTNCKVVLSDGIPFYRTVDGKRTFDPWGGVMNNTSLESIVKEDRKK